MIPLFSFTTKTSSPKISHPGASGPTKKIPQFAIPLPQAPPPPATATWATELPAISTTSSGQQCFFELGIFPILYLVWISSQKNWISRDSHSFPPAQPLLFLSLFLSLINTHARPHFKGSGLAHYFLFHNLHPLSKLPSIKKTLLRHWKIALASVCRCLWYVGTSCYACGHNTYMHGAGRMANCTSTTNHHPVGSWDLCSELSFRDLESFSEVWPRLSTLGACK